MEGTAQATVAHAERERYVICETEELSASRGSYPRATEESLPAANAFRSIDRSDCGAGI